MREMEPWYKVIQPRKEVREGRSFSPDEIAIALEQVVAEPRRKITATNCCFLSGTVSRAPFLPDSS
jgi:hypothetical protein